MGILAVDDMSLNFEIAVSAKGAAGAEKEILGVVEALEMLDKKMGTRNAPKFLDFLKGAVAAANAAGVSFGGLDRIIGNLEGQLGKGGKGAKALADGIGVAGKAAGQLTDQLNGVGKGGKAASMGLSQTAQETKTNVKLIKEYAQVLSDATRARKLLGAGQLAPALSEDSRKALESRVEGLLGRFGSGSLSGKQAGAELALIVDGAKKLDKELAAATSEATAAAKALEALAKSRAAAGLNDEAKAASDAAVNMRLYIQEIQAAVRAGEQLSKVRTPVPVNFAQDPKFRNNQGRFTNYAGSNSDSMKFAVDSGALDSIRQAIRLETELADRSTLTAKALGELAKIRLDTQMRANAEAIQNTAAMMRSLNEAMSGGGFANALRNNGLGKDFGFNATALKPEELAAFSKFGLELDHTRNAWVRQGEAQQVYRGELSSTITSLRAAEEAMRKLSSASQTTGNRGQAAAAKATAEEYAAVAKELERIRDLNINAPLPKLQGRLSPEQAQGFMAGASLEERMASVKAIGAAVDDQATKVQQASENEARATRFATSAQQGFTKEIGTTIREAGDAKSALEGLQQVYDKNGATAEAAEVGALVRELEAFIKVASEAKNVSGAGIVPGSLPVIPRIPAKFAPNADVINQAESAMYRLGNRTGTTSTLFQRATASAQANSLALRGVGESAKAATDKIEGEARAQAQAAAAAKRASEETRKAAIANAGMGKLAPMTMAPIGNFYPLIQATILYGAVSRAALGFSKTAVTTAADYEKAFADVARTTNSNGKNIEGELKKIKGSLEELSTQLPLGFTDLTQIATLGNQLGISSKDIIGFTRLVAQFTTITGLSAEETSKAFGTLGTVLHLDPNDSKRFEKLGSAVSLVGRTSVATEPQVLQMSQRLASTATQAGMTASDIVGLAGAFASMKEAPERTQGGMETFFKVVNTAAAEGGQKMKNFAGIMGMTVKNATDLKRSDPYAFFRAFVQGLNTIRNSSKAGPELVTQALGALGLSDKRVSEVLRRASDNLKVLDQTHEQAIKGFANGNDIQDQASKKTATLAAKWTELNNAISNFMEKVGNSQAVAGLTGMAAGVAAIVKLLTDWASANPAIMNGILILGTMIGVLAALKAAAFGASLATAALSAAQLRLGAAGIPRTLATMASLLFGVRTGTELAAFQLEKLGITSEIAGGEMRFTEKSADAVALALERMKIADEGTGLQLLGESGAIAAKGLVEASAGATLLAKSLVRAGVVKDDALALKVLGEAGLITEKGTILAAEGTGILGRAINFLKFNIRSLADTFVLPILLFFAIDLLTDFAGTMKNVAGVVGWFADWVLTPLGVAFAWLDATVLHTLANIERALGQFMTNMGPVGLAMGNMMKGVADQIELAAKSADENMAHVNQNLKSQMKPFGDWVNSLQSKDKATLDTAKGDKEWAKQQAELKKIMDSMGKITLPENTKQTKKNGAAANAAAKEVRTFADYARDLGDVMGRALDIQFGPQQGFDAIQNSWQQMADGATAARKAIKDAQAQLVSLDAEIHKLSADNRQQTYFLAIARAFGDTTGADSIQAKIDANNASIAEKQNSKADSNKTISDNKTTLDKNLIGNTKAARDNRSALFDLLGQYKDYIEKLAASGISQKELNKKVGEARSKFIDQATSMGFARQQLTPYVTALTGFRTIVDQIPRNVTVAIDARFPAASALSEFWAKEKAAAHAAVNDINNTLGTVGKPKGKPIVIPGITYGPPHGILNARISSDMALIGGYARQLELAVESRKPMSVINNLAYQMKLTAAKLEDDQKATGRFYSGGYTGPGGKYEPAGVVHRGEYVVPKNLVNQQTGLPYADFLGRLVKGSPPSAGYASGGYVDGNGWIELGPRTMRVLNSAIDRKIEARVNPGDIAGTTSAFTANQRRRGQG